MAKFIVEGGKPLRGEIAPAGNKNSALPLIAATLLTDQPVTLKNLPRIRDVNGMLEILAALGATVEQLGPNEVRITAASVKNGAIDPRLSREIRSSLLFAGPLLARFGEASMGPPGGDVIGRRRVDTHFIALGALGAAFETTRDGYRLRTEGGLKGNEVLLDEASVTATENALLASVLAPGRSVIANAASEPHVQELGAFLNELGAEVHGLGTNTIVVNGVRELKGGEHSVWSDHMEVGSLMALAAMTHGEVTIKRCAPAHLRMTRLVFKRLGIDSEVRGDDLFVPAKDRYCIEPDIGGAIPKISPLPWPGFPTDLTSIATAFATQAEGVVLIHEWMYEGRMFFIDSLSNMGARVVLCDPHRAVVIGPSQLYATELRSPDIRAGMALLAATLAAKGTSVINNIEQIDRGYEALDVRLRALGARIERAA